MIKDKKEAWRWRGLRASQERGETEETAEGRRKRGSAKGRSAGPGRPRRPEIEGVQMLRQGEAKKERKNKRDRTRGAEKKSRGTMHCKHTHTHPPHTHPPPHTQAGPCLRHLLMAPRMYWLDMFWTLGWHQGLATLQIVFQSPVKETLLGHWYSLRLHDRGQRIDEQ